MKSNILVILVITIIAKSSSSPDAVDDFNRISASLSKKSSSEIKITEEKQSTKVEIKSKDSDHAAFSSQFLHQGHNLFFQPQILIGPGIKAPFLSRVVEDTTERKNQIEIYINEAKKDVTTTSTTTTTTEMPYIPEPPALPPLVLPDPPVIIQKPIVIEVQEPVREVIIEHDTLVIPEPPAFIPLNPPNIEIIVPCPPAIIIPPPPVVVHETVLVPEPQIMTLRVPKIPLGVIYNRPVKTVMPISNGFVSSTRFLPSVKVSKIPIRPEIVVEQIRGREVLIEEEGYSSFSAYCAHNIALERVLPNIIVGKEIRIAPLPRILEIPVRPVF